MLRSGRIALFLAAATATVGAIPGCAGKPYALDYVVFPNHEAQLDEPPPPVANRQPERTEYPIWGGHPPPTPEEAAEDAGVGGAGSEGCSVGLVGDLCEVGILAGETPLEDRELLPPDGRVIRERLPSPGER